MVREEVSGARNRSREERTPHARRESEVPAIGWHATGKKTPVVDRQRHSSAFSPFSFFPSYRSCRGSTPSRCRVKKSCRRRRP